MSAPAMTDERRTALANAFAAARDRMHTPEALGHALVDFLLTEAAHRGTMSTDGSQIEVPLTATLTVPDLAADTTGHAELCISAFGHHIVCIEYTMSDTHTH